MKAISDIMTRDVTVISPDSNLKDAAQLMRDLDIGAIPVCNGKKMVGMITDRDIVIRGVAEGKTSELMVSEIMSEQVQWCFEDQTVGEVLQQMGDSQIRRIPVVTRDKDLCGLVSLGDLATRDDADMDRTLENVSAPTSPVRASTGKEPTMTRH